MRRFLIIYEKDPRNYSAYCPDLPGCISTGKTRREVERNMREAIQLHLEGFEGRPPAPEHQSTAGYLTI